MGRLLIVSNRLPVTVTVENGSVHFRPSTGGLVTGLAGLLKSEQACWIGWHGYTGSLTSEQKTQLDKSLIEMSMQAISLDPEEIQGYYNDFSNAVVWPLYHYQAEKMPLTIQGWAQYQTVNERFCAAILDIYQEGDFIWVHDYHLQLLPRMLRARLPSAKIGFFLHIPFPSSEIFRILPWRSQILEGLLGSDIIGFHTHAYERHFQSALLRVLGIETQGDHISYAGRTVKIGAFPLGVDVHTITASLASAECELVSALTRMKNDENVRSIMLSIDRLDYTKGLPRRLLAFEKLLDDNPEVRGSVVLVQIAPPSRDQVPAYEENRSTVEGLVGHINGRFGLPGYQPIHYISRNFSQEEILALYPLIDVMVVTPLRDGMNLVAKEFIATRQDLSGVLVLSEFAGASEELGEAIQVNPYDIADTAQGMLSAIRMSPEEQSARMAALRRRIARFDATAWTKRFVELLQNDSETSEVSRYMQPTTLFDLCASERRKMLFLDYDGTLCPIVRLPQLAKPDRDLLSLLDDLAMQNDVELHIVSGRPHQTLDQWLGKLPVYLHAEHGAISRSPGSRWVSAIEQRKTDVWRDFVHSVLMDFTENTPGSFIEEKQHSLTWHYRMADPIQGERMANELRLHGRETFTPLGLEVLPGKCMIEVRQLGINKGLVIRRALEQATDSPKAIAIGDDVTDEDMFQALPPEAISIVVGDQCSKAKHRLRDPSEVQQFLRLFLGARHLRKNALFASKIS